MPISLSRESKYDVTDGKLIFKTDNGVRAHVSFIKHDDGLYTIFIRGDRTWGLAAFYLYESFPYIRRAGTWADLERAENKYRANNLETKTPK